VVVAVVVSCWFFNRNTKLTRFTTWTHIILTHEGLLWNVRNTSVCLFKTYYKYSFEVTTDIFLFNKHAYLNAIFIFILSTYVKKDISLMCPKHSAPYCRAFISVPKTDTCSVWNYWQFNFIGCTLASCMCSWVFLAIVFIYVLFICWTNCWTSGYLFFIINFLFNLSIWTYACNSSQVNINSIYYTRSHTENVFVGFK